MAKEEEAVKEINKRVTEIVMIGFFISNAFQNTQKKKK